MPHCICCTLPGPLVQLPVSKHCWRWSKPTMYFLGTGMSLLSGIVCASWLVVGRSRLFFMPQLARSQLGKLIKLWQEDSQSNKALSLTKTVQQNRWFPKQIPPGGKAERNDHVHQLPNLTHAAPSPPPPYSRASDVFLVGLGWYLDCWRFQFEMKPWLLDHVKRLLVGWAYSTTLQVCVPLDSSRKQPNGNTSIAFIVGGAFVEDVTSRYQSLQWRFLPNQQRSVSTECFRWRHLSLVGHGTPTTTEYWQGLKGEL